MKRIFTTLKEKWPEYLLEILVLIIGIYGAFALEEWSERKNKLERERLLVEEIHEEFVSNLEEFNEVRSSHLKGLNASLWIIKRWSDLENSDPDSLMLHVRQLFHNGDLNVSQSNIETIVNTATFDIIQDEELRRALVLWPKALTSYKNIENKTSEYFSNAFEPHFRKTIDYQDDNTMLNLTLSIESKNIIFGRYRGFQSIIESKEIQELENTMQTIISLTSTK
jgi:hypothetical protein